MSVWPSSQMEQLSSHRTYFRKISYLSLFRNSVHKIQLSLISNKNKPYFIWRRMHIYDNISVSYLRMTYVSYKRCSEVKTHCVLSNVFPWKSCCLLRTVVKCCTAGEATDDNIIRRMRLACWITKAADTHSEYVILIAFSRQQWLRERASIVRLYVYSLPYLHV
jgi:hypothetical protein